MGHISQDMLRDGGESDLQMMAKQICMVRYPQDELVGEKYSPDICNSFFTVTKANCNTATNS